MAVNSVIGKTKVSPALIQTSAARKESGLIAIEVFLMSIFTGIVSSNFVVGFVISFFVLLGLLETKFWSVLSVVFSFGWAFLTYLIFTSIFSSLMVTGIFAGLFVFVLMLSKHHWSLAYWRALVSN